MSETVKQEGDFKLQKRKPAMKKLNGDKGVTKVDLTPKKEEDAVQEQSTDEGVLRAEQPEVELQEMGEQNEERKEPAVEDVKEQPAVIQEITEEEVVEETKKLTEDVAEAVAEAKETGKPLPENIEKLVSFMEETGGDINDYVRLNADYTNVNETTLLREYYKKTKPHLDQEEIEFILEDSFSYDEELDEDRDVRKKKLAFKEEVAKAKGYLETLKSKYYGTTQEQQKAMDFFSRYNEEQNIATQQHERFKADTKQLLNDDFKGFDFDLGEKKFRYGIQNPSQVAEAQSNINNLIKKFLDDKGNVSDTKGYHKAMYAAANADKIAAHFYEQGKADAVKEVVSNSKNPSTATRQQAAGDVFINGLKVKAISGLDSSKLKIKTKRF
jgi:hypothetical protein